MPKRVCQHTEDLHDPEASCKAEATWVTWCNASHTVGVYQCDEHYDPSYEGWVMRSGGVDAEHRPEGFAACRPDDFVAAAREALGKDDVVYLHEPEGAPVIAMLSIEFFRECAQGPHFPPREYTHNHIETDEDAD